MLTNSSREQGLFPTPSLVESGTRWAAEARIGLTYSSARILCHFASILVVGFWNPLARALLIAVSFVPERPPKDPMVRAEKTTV